MQRRAHTLRHSQNRILAQNQGKRKKFQKERKFPSADFLSDANDAGHQWAMAETISGRRPRNSETWRMSRWMFYRHKPGQLGTWWPIDEREHGIRGATGQGLVCQAMALGGQMKHMDCTRRTRNSSDLTGRRDEVGFWAAVCGLMCKKR